MDNPLMFSGRVVLFSTFNFVCSRREKAASGAKAHFNDDPDGTAKAVPFHQNLRVYGTLVEERPLRAAFTRRREEAFSPGGRISLPVLLQPSFRDSVLRGGFAMEQRCRAVEAIPFYQKLYERVMT